MHRTLWTSSWLAWAMLIPTVSAADLTAAGRARIDQAAANYPYDDAREQVANYTDNPTAWLIGQATLSAEEEEAAAKKAQELLLKNHKTMVVPIDVEQLFQKLVKAQPETFKPKAYRFSLTILDVDESAAFTIGAGYVYITRPLLNALLTDKDRGLHAVGFMLAHELGHIARQHCRRGYQHQLIQDEIKNGLVLGLKDDMLRTICRTTMAPAGELAKFVCTSFQEDEADLFAFHLCRNAGLDLDGCLDFLRWAVVQENPKVLTDPAFQPDPKADRAALPYFLESHPPAVRRLKRMLMEKSGGVDDTAKYGLFLFNRQTEKLEKAADNAVGKGVPAVIFVHGLHGDDRGFTSMMTAAAARDDLKNASLLFFRYPNNQSLARAGELLARETARVVASPDKATFIGHSAGGLVVRYYTERKNGAFARAVFLATPHQGSSLTRLKILLDAGTFWERVFMSDVLEAVRVTLSEGIGEMGFDLEPDSLFLNYLDAEPKAADRYVVLYGNVRNRGGLLALDGVAALATAMKLSRPVLKKQITGSMSSELIKHLIGETIDHLDVPPEVLNGDLVVSIPSAKLKGAKRTFETDLDHVAIVRDKAVIDKVLELVAGP